MADGAGAAKRRRERRLRSWAKHERMTVAMALAEQHHIREGEVHEVHHALRGQTRPLPGMRLGLPPEPEPLGTAVTDGNVAAPVLLLVVPSMAGGDGVDGTTTKWLLKVALRKQQEEELEGKVGACAAYLGPRRLFAEEEEKEEEEEKAPEVREPTSSSFCSLHGSTVVLVPRPPFGDAFASALELSPVSVFVVADNWNDYFVCVKFGGVCSSSTRFFTVFGNWLFSHSANSVLECVERLGLT